MSINRNVLFGQLLNTFLEINRETEAIIVSDQEGLIIAGEKRKDIDMEIVSVLTSIINPILDRIRYEFDFKKFGSCLFDTESHRLIFISVNDDVMISLVLNSMASAEKLSPYGYFLAEKTAQILEVNNGELVQITIPNFEYEAQQAIRLRNQLYQLEMDSNGNYRFKFIVIGDHEVGKTSIIRRFVEKKFLADYRATIGLNIMSHEFDAFGNRISVFLWDIGAQEYFKRYRKTYYNGTQAAFIVFDLTTKNSFNNVQNWHNELIEFIENRKLPIIIVGNKKDLEEERLISYDEGVELARTLSNLTQSNITYIETSALTGENVEDAFRLISYNYIVKCKEIEINSQKDKLINHVNSILENKEKLIISFISEKPIWNPGMQILVEVYNIDDVKDYKDGEDEKYYEFTNGLVLKNCVFFLKEVWDSDAVFCLFDARTSNGVNPRWNYIVEKIIGYLQPNKVLVIGIQVSENDDWSNILEEFKIDEELERKMGSVLFFKLYSDTRNEIFNQLEAMFDAIKSLT